MSDLRRYFEKDLFVLQKDFNLYGNTQDIWMLDYDESKDTYRRYFVVFTQKEMVLVPGSPSWFSFEYFPTRMEKLNYNLIKSYSLLEFKVSEIKMWQGVKFSDKEENDTIEVLETIDLLEKKRRILLDNDGVKLDIIKHLKLKVKISF